MADYTRIDGSEVPAGMVWDADRRNAGGIVTEYYGLRDGQSTPDADPEYLMVRDRSCGSTEYYRRADVAPHRPAAPSYGSDLIGVDVVGDFHGLDGQVVEVRDAKGRCFGVPRDEAVAAGLID